MNALCISSKIPRIALTNKQAAFINDNISSQIDKSKPTREDIRQSVDTRQQYVLTEPEMPEIEPVSKSTSVNWQDYRKNQMLSM